MAERKKASAKRKPGPKPADESDQKVCFVVSPIGKKETERHTQFKNVLEYTIKPAVKDSGYKIQVLRADDIDRAGSFIKDILESICSSFVVIADLTEQNPNVFYELGVRHALSPRTILIAQSIDDIPSDLREYRTIVYDSSAKGAVEFSKRIKKYLDEMHKEPERPDNPVLDRIGSIFENKIALLEEQKQELKNELSAVLKKGAPQQKKSSRPSVDARVSRITQLMNAEQQILAGKWTRGDEHFRLPVDQGNFDLYFLQEGTKIKEFWYLSTHLSEFDPEDDLADVRVLMENCVQQGEASCKFIIATGEDLSAQRKSIMDIFRKMKAKLQAKHRSLFELEVWDDSGLLAVEKDLGLKVDL